jgi:hypothetical protein
MNNVIESPHAMEQLKEEYEAWRMGFGSTSRSTSRRGSLTNWKSRQERQEKIIYFQSVSFAIAVPLREIPAICGFTNASWPAW